MTTIAWDGRVLAADRCGTYGNTKTKRQNMFRTPLGCVVLCGDVIVGQLLLTRYFAGTLFEDWPAAQRGDAGGRASMVIVEGKKLWQVFSEPVLVPPPKGKWALGSGSEFATAAMDAGASAVRAVEIACKRDPWSGFGVDSYVVR